MPLIPRRSRPAAYAKAGRLGISKPRKGWSENEILRLRVFYPKGSKEEILAAFPGRTLAAVAKKANSRGIYRAAKKVESTGNRLLDQVLKRAAEYGHSLSDLDRVVRSKTYFSRRRWRKRVDEAVHCRAARALGGTVRAAFPCR
jgi:hypothetical protein